jgi:hypothetical protein
MGTAAAAAIAVTIAIGIRDTRIGIGTHPS